MLKADWSTHKSECKRQNYILKVDLLPRFITNPRITRTLSCPANATFDALHKAPQAVFGWTNTHLHHFEVLNHSDIKGHERPKISRASLFKIADLSTERSGSASRDSSKTRLFKVLDHRETKGKIIHYNYDSINGWQHVISCIGNTAATSHLTSRRREVEME
jgi:hypothetical protein